jgi:two-component system OmpR family sensor kinase
MAAEPVNLVALARDAVDDARAVEPDRSITFEGPTACSATVIGDEPRLRQAIGNLLANVRNHTPPAAAVRVAVTVDDRFARVTVADEGPGLAPEDAERVFDRFYRAEPSRDRTSGGAGLGLSIVASIADAHGGRVDLVTSSGEGAAFTIAIPLAETFGS